MAILLPTEDIKAYFAKVLIALVLADALVAYLTKEIYYENAVYTATISLDSLSDELNDNNVAVTTDLLKKVFLHQRNIDLNIKMKILNLRV